MSGCGALPHAWAAGHGVYLGVWGRGWRFFAGNCFAKIDTVTVCENSEKKKMAGMHGYAISLKCVVVGCSCVRKGFFCRIHLVFLLVFFRVLDYDSHYDSHSNMWNDSMYDPQSQSLFCVCVFFP